MTHFTHVKNRKKSNYIGVFQDNNKWFFKLKYNGNNSTVGPFKDERKAALEYDNLKISLNPNQKNGKSLNFFHEKLEKKMIDRKESFKKKKKRKREESNDPPKKRKRRFKRHKRRAIRKGELWPVLIRQDFRCNICENMFNCPPIMDHIIPLEIGGNYKLNNLQGICALCNSWKSGMYDKQIKGMMKYNKMTPEEILLIQKKVYDDKFRSKPEQVINVNNISSSTVNFIQK